MRSIDENNNGEIDYEEFVTACINTHQWAQKEAVIREAFNSFDLDGDGTIDIFELHEALRKSGNKQVKEISVEVERILNEVGDFSIFDYCYDCYLITAIIEDQPLLHPGPGGYRRRWAD